MSDNPYRGPKGRRGPPRPPAAERGTAPRDARESGRGREAPRAPLRPRPAVPRIEDDASATPRTGAARELRIHGFNACRAAFEARPQDLRKVYLLESRIPALRDVLAWCVKHRLGYRVVEDDDLQKLTGSSHHEGVLFEMRERTAPGLAELLQRLPDGPQALLWLDGVGNPHNFGALLRSAAHFGTAAVLLPQDSQLTLSGAACRVAEGGAESVHVVRMPALPEALQALRQAGFVLAATLPRGGDPIYATGLPPRLVLVFGAEQSGMQPALVEACTLRLGIPGTGRVESLNIASAVAVMLGECWRRHVR